MDLFWTLNQFLDISIFSFDPLPPWNRWGCCCLMGPACHPLRTVNVSFLGFCLPNDFLAYFFFRSPAAVKTLRTLLAHGSHMSASMNNKRWGCCCLVGPACHPLRTKMFLFLDFLPTDFWFIFSFHPLPPLKRRCWLMGPRCQPPRTRNMWYLDYFADNKQCISLWAIANG